MKKLLLLGLLLVIIGVIYIKKDKEKSDSALTVNNCETNLKQLDNTVQKFDGTSKPVDFSNFPKAKTYYTRITESVKKGPDFAGHYRLATWGCGTDCFGWALVDLNSGKVVSYEPVNSGYHLRNIFDVTSSYFALDPLYSEEERKFYAIKNMENGENTLELACTEKAEQDYYTPQPGGFQ